MALLMVVITGFMALTIDAGMGYMQSRSDQDVSDAVALAASFDVSAGDSLTAVYTAALQVASLDGCSADSSCNLPYLQVWTASSYTASPDYYVNGSGTTGCATGVSGPYDVTCPTSGVRYVGAPVTDAGHAYFAQLASAGGRGYAIQSSAIAEVPTSGSKSGGSGITFPCQICVLDKLSASNNLDTVATSGDVDVNNALSQSGSTCIITASAGGINLPPSKDVSIGTGDGCTYSASTTPVPNYESTAGWMSTKWPSTGSWPSGDPLSGARLGSFTGYSAGTECASNCSEASSWASVSQSSDWTTPGDGTFEFRPGTYYGITTDASSSNPVVLEFDPGVYIFYGDGINIGGGTVTLEDTPATSGVTLYFTCDKSYAPTNCSSGATGASFSTSAANATIDLSAPTSGAEGNMLLWFDPYSQPGRHGASFSLNGTETTNLSGAIYMASGTLAGSPSTGSGCALPGPIIAKEITLGGGCDLTLNGQLVVQASPATPGNLVS